MMCCTKTPSSSSICLCESYMGWQECVRYMARQESMRYMTRQSVRGIWHGRASTQRARKHELRFHPHETNPFLHCNPCISRCFPYWCVCKSAEWILLIRAVSVTYGRLTGMCTPQGSQTLEFYPSDVVFVLCFQRRDERIRLGFNSSNFFNEYLSPCARVWARA